MDIFTLLNLIKVNTDNLCASYAYVILIIKLLYNLKVYKFLNRYLGISYVYIFLSSLIFKFWFNEKA